MKLLLVDGSNIVMRAALGGELAPAQAVATATNIIQRCGREFGVTHLIVCLDCPSDATSWRRAMFSDYKANRTRDTSPWLLAAHEAWSLKKWWVEAVNSFEADDVIATIASRASLLHDVFVLSGDSDLLPLMCEGVQIIRPLDGGKFAIATDADVVKKYGIPSASMLVDLKAMTGESGDNIPGVDGIGKVRAAALLERFQTLAGVFEAGHGNHDKYAAKVYDQKLVVELAHRLITLRRDVPVPPIIPSACRFTA